MVQGFVCAGGLCAIGAKVQLATRSADTVVGVPDARSRGKHALEEVAHTLTIAEPGWKNAWRGKGKHVLERMHKSLMMHWCQTRMCGRSRQGHEWRLKMLRRQRKRRRCIRDKPHSRASRAQHGPCCKGIESFHARDRIQRAWGHGNIGDGCRGREPRSERAEEEQDNIANILGKRVNVLVQTAMMAMLVNETLLSGEVCGHLSGALLDPLLLHEGRDK